MYNTVQLVNSSGQSGWTVYLPDGSTLDISASTTCGLQEAINWAAENGYHLSVIGRATGSAPAEDYGILNCASQIIVPPLRMMDISMRGVHVAFSPAVTADGLLFDSIQNCKIEVVGEITYQGSGCAVMFKPRTAIPVDTTTEVNGSEIKFAGIVAAGGMPTALVGFYPSSGGIIGNRYYFGELNGSGSVEQSAMAQFGIVCEGASATNFMSANRIEVGEMHGVTSTGVQVGVNSTNQGHYNSNTWRINELVAGSSNPSGFNSFGTGDDVRIGALSGTGGYAVYLQPGSAHNFVRVGSCSGMTAKNDLGTSNTVNFN